MKEISFHDSICVHTSEIAFTQLKNNSLLGYNHLKETQSLLVFCIQQKMDGLKHLLLKALQYKSTWHDCMYSTEQLRIPLYLSDCVVIAG